MKHKINSLLPALRVHTWGGYGSQLFTAHLILKLQRRFPGRSIFAINHTSGVSRRVTEFDFSSLGVRVKQIEDFVEKHKSSKEFNSSRKEILNVIKSLKSITLRALKMVRILQEANNNATFNSIKPWTIVLRGHYTKVILEKELVEELYILVLNSLGSAQMESSKIVIHYRLGDLLFLQEKSPVNPKRIESILNSMILGDVIPVVLTDSSSEVFTNFVSKLQTLTRCYAQKLGPIPTLKLCVEADTFIGTGAKISLWAAIFRDFKHKKMSYLPRELSWAEEIGLTSSWY